jgi:YbgC/YbaW family acyl-CoA thioester hydrolase
MNSVTKQVYLHNTDAMGHVYYADVLNWFEEIRMDILSEIKPLTEWINEGIVFMPRNVNVKYLAPIKLLDQCEIRTNIVLGKVKVTFEHHIIVNDVKCVQATIDIIMLNNGKLSKIPKELLNG